MRHLVRRLPFTIALLTWAGGTHPVQAQQATGAPVPIADAKGTVGAGRVTLAERSPLSADLTVLAKRVGLTHATSARKPATPPVPAVDLTDYDLSKETFSIYVPPSSGDGGKYGLMVGQCFKEYGWPATAWPAVLDKYHLIWIGAIGAGDSRPVAQRVGLLLDAAHNAAKTWPIDPGRVYLSMNSFVDAASGTAFYYPDVFDGEIQSVGVPWFTKVKGFEHPPLTWNTDKVPPPQSKDLGLAKSHSRFYLAVRGDAYRATNDAVIRHGYKQLGFKYVTSEAVPEADMGHYVNYSADWFDRGVAFLDAPLAELRAKAAKPRPVGRPLARPIPLPPG